LEEISGRGLPIERLILDLTKPLPPSFGCNGGRSVFERNGYRFAL